MSGFLTFSRRTLVTSSRTSAAISKPITTRTFSIAASRQASGVKEGKQPDSDHTTRKDDRLDVQTDNSVAAREYVDSVSLRTHLAYHTNTLLQGQD
jgi:hypothetical protein